MESDELLTTREAARALGVSPTSIKRWADDGRLPAHRTAGGHRRYLRSDVERLLKEEQQSVEADDRPLPDRLPHMSRACVDELPVGVIQLADDGTILLYNATESRFSGIGITQAEGKHFFGELAPCCNNRLVYGRFKEGVQKGEMDVRLDYTFTYRMRPTNVELHLYRHAGTSTNWLIVKPRR